MLVSGAVGLCFVTHNQLLFGRVPATQHQGIVRICISDCKCLLRCGPAPWLFGILEHIVSMSHNYLALIDRAKVLDMVMVFAFKRVILSCEQ